MRRLHTIHDPATGGGREPAPRRCVALCLDTLGMAPDRLSAMLGVDAVVTPAAVNAGDAIRMVLAPERGSGHRLQARHAARLGVPLRTVGEGWLLSSRARHRPEHAYSIRLDWQRLGAWLDDDTAQHPGSDALAYAARCRHQLLDAGISRYNFYRQASPVHTDSQPRVLVVDQVSGSVPPAQLLAMLDTAQAENPGSQVLVRADSADGARPASGVLAATARARGLTVLDAGCDPLAQLAGVERVYTHSAWLGYEAMLMEKPVVIFGAPFYAGRGLGDDRFPGIARCRRHSIDALFHATHVQFARYANPVTGDTWQLHECLAHIALQKHWFAENAQRFQASGITAWKRGYIRQYLRSPDGELHFGISAVGVESPGVDSPGVDSPGVDSPGVESQRQAVTPVTWGFRRFAERNDGSVTRIEDGFLRSLGLGSDFNAPSSLVVDRTGMYFDPARPSELENLLNRHECSETQLNRAAALKSLILSAGLSKYNLGTKGKLLDRPADKAVVLVVGQVEDDQSIQRGCDAIRTNAALLQAVRARMPHAHVRYKPHPDVVAGNRRGSVPREVLDRCADELVENASIVDCIETCDELHTMTSLSGFEALLRGRRVVTYGSPFYAGWGLTEDLQPLAGRQRKRSLDELVYLALIAYPRYVDIDTGEFMTPEDLVIKINKQLAMSKNSTRTSWSVRQLSKAMNIVRGIGYAP